MLPALPPWQPSLHWSWGAYLLPVCLSLSFSGFPPVCSSPSPFLVLLSLARLLNWFSLTVGEMHEFLTLTCEALRIWPLPTSPVTPHRSPGTHPAPGLLSVSLTRQAHSFLCANCFLHLDRSLPLLDSTCNLFLCLRCHSSLRSYYMTSSILFPGGQF